MDPDHGPAILLPQKKKIQSAVSELPWIECSSEWNDISDYV